MGIGMHIFGLLYHSCIMFTPALGMGIVFQNCALRLRLGRIVGKLDGPEKE